MRRSRSWCRSEYLPWHASARARLAGAIAGGRMPHALLLHGADGLGKERFAATLAAGLLCARPGPDLMPCGSCADCSLESRRVASRPALVAPARGPQDHRRRRGARRLRAARHDQPARRLPGRGRGIGGPDDARTPRTPSSRRSRSRRHGRCWCWSPQRPSRLAATLRSRCQRIEIPRPGADEALDWLRRELGSDPPPGLLDRAGGAPLRARRLRRTTPRWRRR